MSIGFGWGQGAGTLADGRAEIPWGDVPGRLADVRAQLRHAGVAPGEPIAVPGANTLPCALALLAGMEDGHDLVLVPPGAAAPGFCAARLVPGEDGAPARVERMPTAAPITLEPGRGHVIAATSGSTGAPRFVVHDATRLRANARAVAQRLGLRPEDRIALPVPLHHLFGLGAAFLPAVLVGAGLDLQEGANLPRFVARERDFDPDVVFLTPAFAGALVRGRRSARGYRLTVVAGDRLPEALFDAYEARFGPVVQLYGSSELGAVAAAHPEDPAAVRRVSVGQPLAGVRLRCEPPAEGELRCLHANGFIGYVDGSGAFCPHDVAEAWHPTRDRARLDFQGNLFLLGRLDHQVNRDGLLVSLHEVEEAVAALDGVDAAAAVSAGETPRGSGIVAFCTVDETEPDGDALRRALSQRPAGLSQRAIPDAIEVVASLPLLAGGKVDRRRLARRAEEVLKGAPASPVRFLQVEPTTRCNFTCGFCAGRHMDQSDLDESTFEAALTSLRDLEHLELQGEGEPLLHPGFFEMASRATSRGIRVSTITNGSLFTRERVARLLDCGIASVLVSIESPDAEEFQRIRGGKLDKVLRGIRLLLEEREKAGRSEPRVGFAVTVLADTQNRLGEILELYGALGMDGGISVQMLNPMASYARHYDGDMAGQALSPLAQTLARSRWDRLHARTTDGLPGPENFFSALMADGGDASTCPWLEAALYVDRHGAVDACPYRKSGRAALGSIGVDGFEAILSAREGLRFALGRGTIPEGCAGCAIAQRAVRATSEGSR